MKASLLQIWWVHFLCLGEIQANIRLSLNQNYCEDLPDVTKLIEFRHNHKCLQIVLNDDLMPCFWKIIGSSFMSLKIRSSTYLEHRNIRSEERGRCQTFLIFGKSISDVKETLHTDRQERVQFFPFTKIYIYVSGNNYNDSVTTNKDSMAEVKNFLTRNALFGYLFEVTKDKIGFYQVVIKDLLTNDLKRPVSSYTPSDLLHPIVDTRLAKDNFRISLFNCKPFTFYPENASDSTILNKMDGTEFRFVKEVTKNWKKTYNFRDFSRTKIQPYSLIMNDLSNRTSDLAMCSIWLLEKYYKNYDLSTFYDHTCTTFLVPKPTKLNEASAIYTALSPFVWLLFIISFVLSSVLLTVISKLEKRLYQRESQYLDLTRAILETISIAVSHPVHRLPNGQVPVKIILVSWIMLSTWMGISYTTIYASTLTSPDYEKPINTVKQFVNSRLSLCSPYLYVDPIEQYRTSVNEDYRQLSTRSLIYGEDSAYRKQLFADRKCGVFAHRPMKKFVTSKAFDTDAEVLLTMRLMRDCVSNYYTGFAFQKFTPYAKLFSWHIRRFQEYGIIQKWYLDFSTDQQGVVSIFEDHPQPDSRRQINLVNVSGAFFLLFTGLLISVISFLIEFIQ